MAEVAGCTLRRTRAVGGAAAGMRRELEIEKFIPREYWSLVATLTTPRGESFEAAGWRRRQEDPRLDIGTGAEAEDFKKAIEAANFTVSRWRRSRRAAIRRRLHHLHPAAEASRKLGFAPAHTMRIAQRLYEGIDIAARPPASLPICERRRADRLVGDYPGAQGDIRGLRQRLCAEAARQYQTKAKNAQEAHEAIRPTDLSRRPAEMRRRLDTDQAKLYELIWIRTIASQMESAELERTTVDIAPRPAPACWNCAPPGR